MRNIRKCKNKCIFCFVDQLPDGLRKTLYIKDDDYLLSYTKNNFITLSNLNKKDIEKIIKYELKPLHVSVHSLNPEIRKKVFGNDLNKKGIENLKLLDNSGINSHTQIVLCPGINDGNELIDTLDKLISNYKNISSIGLVPVGITKFSKSNLLKPFNKEKSIDLIEMINNYKKNNYRYRKKIKNIYISDEFYILAGIDFPDYSSYGDFPQIGNGIGKSMNFLKSAEEYLKNISIEKINYNKKILIITSEYGIKIINRSIDMIDKELKSYPFKFSDNICVQTVKNDFLGGNVKITGLLTGKDIMENLKNINLDNFDKILFPDCIFNNDLLTIDNYSKEDFKNKSDKIYFIDDCGHELIKGIFN